MTEDHNLPAPANAQMPVPRTRASLAAELAEDSPTPPSALLKRYLSALLRYKWLMIALVIVGTTGAAVGSRYLPLSYIAEGTIWLEGAGGTAAGPIQAPSLMGSTNWIELLRSYTVLDQVVRDQGLYLEYRPRDADVFADFRLDTLQFYPGRYVLWMDAEGRTAELRTDVGMRLETVRAGEPIGRSRGFMWQPEASEFEPKRVVKFEVLTPREAARQINRRLVTRLPRGSSFVTVQYSGSDPRRVAGVVNGVADRFVEVATELKASRTKFLSEALVAQLEAAYQSLTSAEMDLNNFLIQTATLPSEAMVNPSTDLTRPPPAAMSTYMGYSVTRESLQRDREAIARAFNRRPGEPLSVDALTTVASVQQSPELSQALGELTQKRAGMRALLQQFTPLMPVVQAAQADLDTLEAVTIPELAQRLVAALVAEETRMDGLLAGSAEELRAIPSRTLTEARLRRSVSHADRLYNDLRSRYETAKLAGEATVPDVRIMDRASTPQRPTLDPRFKMILLGFAGSLGLAVALALALDRIDPRLRYAEQVSHEMGLTIIGAVPNLTNGRGGASAAAKGAEVVEALRGIRLNLMHAYGSAGPISLTLSSPGSGDGKTFLTSNLALAFADLGYRTLVIDGDTRRGDLHRLFGIERRPGLTDFLDGAVDEAAAIYKTRFPLVDVIPGGKRMSNGPELLSSARMGDLLAHIRAEYQVILVDSPPLGAGVDPLVLATLTGNLMLVMRTGTTSRIIAGAKLAMLDRLPTRLLGAVLNGFDSGEAYRYYSYLAGYEASGEETEEDTGKQLQPV